MTEKLLSEKPPGWFDHIRKYYTDNAMSLEEIEEEATGAGNASKADTACLNFKLLNYRGDMIIKVGRGKLVHSRTD